MTESKQPGILTNIFKIFDFQSQENIQFDILIFKKIFLDQGKVYQSKNLMSQHSILNEETPSQFTSDSYKKIYFAVEDDTILEIFLPAYYTNQEGTATSLGSLT